MERKSKFDKRFKMKVVRMSMVSKNTLKDVAKEFGISPQNLSDWRKKYMDEVKLRDEKYSREKETEKLKKEQEAKKEKEMKEQKKEEQKIAEEKKEVANIVIDSDQKLVVTTMLQAQLKRATMAYEKAKEEMVALEKVIEMYSNV